ncbi:MAG: hypothetical protein MJ180_04145, partial [Candidatus Gastranaerophilales bacterium]|nr:hypothetical protein [Candidatus Gastranaerophilales bacterium]
GGEEKANSVCLQYRGRIHLEYLNNEKYSHIADFKDELAKIYNLRNDENLTSLINGDTILLKQQGGDKARGVIGMYRYNDKDDVIILIHNAGFNSSRNFDENKSITINKIDLSAGKATYVAEQTYDKGEVQVGLPEGKQLEENTIYVDALDETKEYIVEADGNIYAMDSSNINLEHTVTILKRKNK